MILSFQTVLYLVPRPAPSFLIYLFSSKELSREKKNIEKEVKDSIKSNTKKFIEIAKIEELEEFKNLLSERGEVLRNS